MLILFAASLCVSQSDPEALRFAERHQWVTSVALGLSGNYTARSDATNVVNLNVEPAFDYFVINNLSIGGVVEGQYSGTHSPSEAIDKLAMGAGIRVGYNVPFSRRLSLWPRLQLDVLYTSQSVSASGLVAIATRPYNGLELNAKLGIPLVIVLASHVYWAVGPYLALATIAYQFPTVLTPLASTKTSQQIQLVEIGLGTSVGGYF